MVKSEKRGVIPRWRGIKPAEGTGELHFPIPKSKTLLPFQSRIYIEEQIQAWQANNDVVHAADLLSSAFTLGLEQDFAPVAKFILDSDINASSPIRKVAKKVLKIEELISEENLSEDHNELSEALDPTRFYSEIKKHRSYLKREPNNPISWVELGRLYSMVQQHEKAEQCVQRALYLNKDNRFIARSASRFFHHHYPTEDRALQVIKKSQFAKVDPWLLSAEIAYSGILERHSTFAKTGVEYVKNFNADFLSITELTSALGTLELTNGKVKDAKRYFSTSLIAPNDNSIAQVSWASKNLPGVHINVNQYELPLAYEAQAQVAYNEKRYNEAYSYALKWLNDEPFSSRPIVFASHIAAVYLNSRTAAIEILKKGVTVNPEHSLLNNNLIYYLAKEGFTQESRSLFEAKLKQHLEGNIEIDAYTVIATAGLLEFREGNPTSGRKLYNKAIELIKLYSGRKDLDKDHTLSIANLNLIDEELRYVSSIEGVAPLMKQAEMYSKKTSEEDVAVFYVQLKKSFEAKIEALKQISQ